MVSAITQVDVMCPDCGCPDLINVGEHDGWTVLACAVCQRTCRLVVETIGDERRWRIVGIQTGSYRMAGRVVGADFGVEPGMRDCDPPIVGKQRREILCVIVAAAIVSAAAWTAVVLLM